MTAAPMLPNRQEWTVDHLGELPRDLPYELINGRLIVPAFTHLHQDLCERILLALEANCPSEYEVSTDLAMKVNRRNEPRPDVVALRPDHMTHRPVPIEDAVLVVEVISRGSSFRDMYDKARVYAHAGVPLYWLVDPLHPQVRLTEFGLGPAGDYEAATDTEDVFSTERPWKVTVDLPALTDRWAGLRERTEG